MPQVQRPLPDRQDHDRRVRRAGQRLLDVPVDGRRRRPLLRLVRGRLLRPHERGAEVLRGGGKVRLRGRQVLQIGYRWVAASKNVMRSDHLVAHWWPHCKINL